MSAGRSVNNSGLPLHLRQLENVHYDGGVAWMLIPDDKGVLHIAILTEIPPPVTREVAADVRLNLYTKYVLVFFQVLKMNGCRFQTRHITNTPQILIGVPGSTLYG